MKRLIYAAKSETIPYQLVSMAAILRDLVSDVQYKNSDHRKLVDIADSIYNMGIEPNQMYDEYKNLYYQYDKSFWDKVFDDMSAIDSQLTSPNKEDELLADYNDRLGIVASTKVTATKWYYHEPMTAEELSSLKSAILDIPGCNKVEFDESGIEEMGQLIILPYYDDIKVSDPDYYALRKQLLNSVIQTAKKFGLTRTEDAIEDYGSCFYIVFKTNKPKTDRYDEF